MNKYMSVNVIFAKFSRDYIATKKYLPIRPSEMGVLNILTRCEGDFTPMKLAETLGVSKPMVTAHINVLLKKGYVRKEPSPDDKRSFYVRPTEKAIALADEAEAKQTEYIKAVEERLGEKDFAALTELMEKAQVVLGEMIDR